LKVEHKDSRLQDVFDLKLKEAEEEEAEKFRGNFNVC